MHSHIEIAIPQFGGLLAHAAPVLGALALATPAAAQDTHREHAASSDADRATLDAALLTFRDPARLFVTDKKADCRIEHVDADIEAPGGDHGDGADKHTELHAEYHFGCTAPWS